jgi:hypothetical protein
LRLYIIRKAGPFLPPALYWSAETADQIPDPNMHAAIAPWFFLGVALEIAALVIGIIAWPDVFAKATVVVTISVIIVFLLLFMP